MLFKTQMPLWKNTHAFHTPMLIHYPTVGNESRYSFTAPILDTSVVSTTTWEHFLSVPFSSVSRASSRATWLFRRLSALFGIIQKLHCITSLSKSSKAFIKAFKHSSNLCKHLCPTLGISKPFYRDSLVVNSEKPDLIRNLYIQRSTLHSKNYCRNSSKTVAEIGKLFTC